MVKVGGAGLKRCEGSIYWLSTISMAENPAGGYTGSSRKMKGPPSIRPEKSRGARGGLPPYLHPHIQTLRFVWTHVGASGFRTLSDRGYPPLLPYKAPPYLPSGKKMVGGRYPLPPDSIMSNIPVLHNHPTIASCGVSGVNGRNIVILINEKDSKIRNMEGGVGPLRKNIGRGVGGVLPLSYNRKQLD
jgi:hypothetical protein